MTELNHSVYAIYKWLLSRHIKVPLEWVQECVSFLVSEGISQDLMCDSVYEQWLVSDVKTLQEGVINFNTDMKELKNEVFALQMNYAIDISKSRFSQLRALLGVNDGNTDVQAFEDPNTKWEPKPSRCLLLELTDGVQQVKGIEVEPLCELSTALECGTKVLIKGPIKCVRGCLLLRKNCISILGGHVDELVERYSQPSVLKSLLDNVAASQHRELCSKSFPNAGKIKGAKADIKPKSLTDIKQAPAQAARNLECVTATVRRNANVMPSSMAIEWDDGMSEDEFIAETKFEPKVSSPVTKSRTGPISELPVDTKPGYTKPSPAPPTSMDVFQSADEVNWSDDDFDSHGQNNAGKGNANPISSRAPNLSFSQTAGRTPIVAAVDTHHGNQSFTEEAFEDAFDDSVDWSDNMDFPQPRGVSHVPEPKGMSRISEPRGVSHIPKPRGMSHIPEPRDVSHMSEPTKLQPSEKNIQKCESNTSVIDLLSSDDEDFGIPSESHNASVKTAPFSALSKCSDNSTMNKATANHSHTPTHRGSARIDGDIAASGDVETANRRENVGATGKCSDFHAPYFHYLSQLPSLLEVSKRIIVKAHISTVLDKIGTSKDKREWTLSVRINDGTGYLDCQLSHHILESAIGPVRETIKKSNSNLTQRRIIIQKMKNFGDYLSSVNGFMELDLSAPALPTLTNIRQPTSADITLFRQCLAQR